MDWKSKLRRTRSLSAGPSFFDRLARQDKIMSVSQLVARYQPTQKGRDGDSKPKQVLKEPAPPPPEIKETPLESLMKRNHTRERGSGVLSRSKSMSSLQSGAVSIGALAALFEAKTATRNKPRSSFRDANIMPAEKGQAKERKSSAEEPKIQNPAGPPVDAAKAHAKDHVTQRAVKPRRVERRKTIGGIDFEKIAAAQADEKRRSIADFRDKSFNPTKEKLCVSVKAMSALYLSKVAPQDSRPAQVQSAESGKRIKPTKPAQLRTVVWRVLLHISLPTTVQKKRELRRGLWTRSTQEPMAPLRRGVQSDRVRGVNMYTTHSPTRWRTAQGPNCSPNLPCSCTGNERQSNNGLISQAVVFNPTRLCCFFLVQL